MDMFFTDGYAPFSIALLVFLGLFALELLLLVVGVGLSDFVDDVLPDSDASHEFTSLGKALTFVGCGKIPSMIVIMMLFAFFGVTGILIQSTLYSLFGSTLASWIASIPSLLLTVILTHYGTRLLAPLMSNDETFAVSERSLIGRTAIVVYGTASHALPAEAEVRDEHGRLHHIQLKASEKDDVFAEGDSVQVCRVEDGFFYGLKPTETTYFYSEKDQ
jgi:hypothetical protein